MMNKEENVENQVSLIDQVIYNAGEVWKWPEWP